MQDLSKHYQIGSETIQAVKNLNLSIEEGEWVGIMGASGSGKSTLLHLLGCLDKPSHGSYFLNGQDISLLNDLELASIRASKIGFVFQSFNLIPQLTVWENVEIPFLYQATPIPKKEKEEKIFEALKKVGLSHRCSHLPSQLSGGETQRAAIARAISRGFSKNNPLIVLADEPTGNLDTENGANILSLFRDLNIQGVTIVLITHDEEVGKHCHRVMRMKDGKQIG